MKKKKIEIYRYKPLPKVFLIHIGKVNIGLWVAEYNNSYYPKFGFINHYSYFKWGFHIKGYLFEISWEKKNND